MNLDDLKAQWKAHDDATLEAKKTMWRLYAQVQQLRKIATAAARCVSNPAWAGICDEDVELERVLREAGLLPEQKES